MVFFRLKAQASLLQNCTHRSSVSIGLTLKLLVRCTLHRFGSVAAQCIRIITNGETGDRASIQVFGSGWVYIFYKTQNGTALEMVWVWLSLKPKKPKTPKPELNPEKPKKYLDNSGF